MKTATELATELLRGLDGPVLVVFDVDTLACIIARCRAEGAAAQRASDIGFLGMINGVVGDVAMRNVIMAINRTPPVCT